MSMVQIGFVILILVSAQQGFAQSATNLTGVIGEYSNETGSRGAVTNRRIADELYRQSLQDERNAWKSFPPNVSLLSRALANSKDAKTADDQAKEFARAALHGLNSGSHSGKFDAAAHGIVSQQELKNLSEKSSPLRPQVESALNSYSGMKLDADKMVLKTPFGDVSVDVDRDTMTKVMKGAAIALGYSADDVQRGVDDAARVRDEIAQKVMKDVDAQIVAAKKSAGEGGAGAGPNSAVAAAQDAQGAQPEGVNEGQRDPASAGLPAGTDKNGIDWAAKQREFQANQNQIRRQMGMNVQSAGADPLGAKNQNLFQMVHEKYQSIRATGVFIETMEPIAATSRSSKPH